MELNKKVSKTILECQVQITQIRWWMLATSYRLVWVIKMTKIILNLTYNRLKNQTINNLEINFQTSN